MHPLARDVDAEASLRGRQTSVKHLKRPRTPSPAYSSKLRILTAKQAQNLVNRETSRLYRHVQDMGVDYVPTPEDSLATLEEEKWRLQHRLQAHDDDGENNENDQNEAMRMTEEGIRFDIEVERGAMAERRRFGM